MAQSEVRVEISIGTDTPKPVDAFKTLPGYGGTNNVLNVKAVSGTAHYKFTFTGLVEV